MCYSLFLLVPGRIVRHKLETRSSYTIKYHLDKLYAPGKQRIPTTYRGIVLNSCKIVASSFARAANQLS